MSNPAMIYLTPQQLFFVRTRLLLLRKRDPVRSIKALLKKREHWLTPYPKLVETLRTVVACHEERAPSWRACKAARDQPFYWLHATPTCPDKVRFCWKIDRVEDPDASVVYRYMRGQRKKKPSK